MQDADWVKAQSFSFEGNADQVASLFMAAEDWRQVDERVIHLTKDNQFMMEAVLGAMTAPRAFVSIGVTASVAAVGVGQEPVWSLENDMHEWLHSASIGEIALHQGEAGKCIGELWIEQDPRKLGSDVSSLWHLAHHFMGELWHQLVSEWIESRPESLHDERINWDTALLNLTPREKEVAKLIYAGMGTGKITEKLVIGRSTVKTHEQKIAEFIGMPMTVNARFSVRKDEMRERLRKLIDG